MLSRSTVKYIQSLTHRKFRDIHHSFIAETPKVVSEFINSSFQIEQIYATDEWVGSFEDKEKIGLLPVTIITNPELEKISQLKTPHKVAGIFKIPNYPIPTDLSGKISVALDDLQDPGNMGTIIRIADWFGVENIFCSQHTANAYNPKVVQSSMGSLAHVKVHYLELESFLRDCNQKTIAATLQGTSLYKAPPIKEGILLIGNEASGIRDSLLKISTKQITIPRFGRAESLNAAIATAIFLSHFRSQQ